MISVGIHPDLVIKKVEKNEQGTLVIKVKSTKKIDPMAALNASGQTSFNQPEQEFLIFPPKVTNFSGELDSFENIQRKIAELKDPLDHIASVYVKLNQRKWDMFKNAGFVEGMSQDEFAARLQQQGTLDKIYNNIVDQFITMMTPHIGDNSKKVRMLFVRSNAAKHFPKLPTKRLYLNSWPFIEPMDVPVSKLKYSDYEIKNGQNNPDPVGESQVVSKEEAQVAENLFSN